MMHLNARYEYVKKYLNKIVVVEDRGPIDPVDAVQTEVLTVERKDDGSIHVTFLPGVIDRAFVTWQQK